MLDDVKRDAYERAQGFTGKVIKAHAAIREYRRKDRNLKKWARIKHQEYLEQIENLNRARVPLVLSGLKDFMADEEFGKCSSSIFKCTNLLMFAFHGLS